MMADDDFDAELAQRDEELETARANLAADPETFELVSSEYAEWRRGIRLLAGRPANERGQNPPDVEAFLDAHPDHPIGGATVTTEDGAE